MSMKLANTFILSFKALYRNKSRSALTILGIVIGIASIMAIFSVGEGAQISILGELSSLGGETIVIRPGQEPTGPSNFAETIFSDSLKTADVEALSRPSNVPTLAKIAPGVIVPGGVSHGSETSSALIFGWDAQMLADAFHIVPEEGIAFDQDAIRRKDSVAMIGQDVKDELFGNSPALNETIKIRGRNFRVIGILPSRGQLAFFNVDELVLVPWSTAQTYLLGIDHFHEIVVKANSPGDVDRTVYDIEATLRETHGITDLEKDDFFVVTQEGLVSEIEAVLEILTIFLSAVVAIALLVGGIGLMNIMLVSVTERTREIGLRKAVGATKLNIQVQFLIEAVVLTLFGGLLGILAGAFFSLTASIGITYFTDFSWPFTFPIQGVLIGTLGAALVGLVFGIYPAVQAAKKDPIDALRYE